MESIKRKLSGSRLYLTALAVCTAVAAIALLFVAKPVTSASAAAGYASVSFDSAENPNTVTFSRDDTYVISGTDVRLPLTAVFVTIKDEQSQTVALAGWPASEMAGFTYDFSALLYNSEGAPEDSNYLCSITGNRVPVTLENGTYSFTVTFYYGVYEGRPRQAVGMNSFSIKNPLPLPEAPAKEGHTFTGWYLDEDCTQPYDGRPIYEDTELYAGWEINKYTVTFNSNGGEAVEALTVEWNSTPDALPTPVREGHTFLGWYDGDSLYSNAPITADKTLTAQWQINTYTVTFMSDGEVFKEVVVEWGTSFQTIMNANGMTYFNLLTTEGAKMSKGTPVKSDMTVAVEEMTGQEKAAEFFAQNWWVLIVAGVALVIVTAIIVSAVKGKRR